MSKILRCKKCGDIIQSKHRHDMVACKCGAIAIDGGDDYCKMTGSLYDMEFLVEESKVADLEAKLAESEKKLALCEELRDVEETEYSEDISKTNSALFRKCQQTTRLIEENKQLKQQLAEKEKEIEDLNKFMSDKADEIEDLKERISNKITSAYGAELMAKDVQWHLEKEIQELKQKQNQTPITELEKVKEFAIRNKFVVSDYHNLDLAELNYGICFEILCKQIDQQIKELKGETNE